MLPEYFCLMGRRDTDKLALREAAGDGPVQGFLADAARELGLWIVGGTLPLAAGDDAHVRQQLAGLRAGRRAAWRATTRSTCSASTTAASATTKRRVIAPRQRAACCSTCPRATATRWRIGMSVCYDLRFPELYRALARRAPTCCWCPAPSPTPPAQAHWEVLLRARAIENLAWVVAPAQGGMHENGRRTWGQSMVVDPWGDGGGAAGREARAWCWPSSTPRGSRAGARAQLPALAHRVL